MTPSHPTRRNVPERYSIVDSPVMTTEGSAYDPSRPTFWITHGYLNNGNMSWQADLKDAILSQVRSYLAALELS